MPHVDGGLLARRCASCRDSSRRSLRTCSGCVSAGRSGCKWAMTPDSRLRRPKGSRHAGSPTARGDALRSGDDRAEHRRTRTGLDTPQEHRVFPTDCLIPKPTPRRVNVDRPCDAVEQAVERDRQPGDRLTLPRPRGCEPRISCGRQVAGRDAVGDRVEHAPD